MRLDDIDAMERLLSDWADFMHRHDSIAEGYAAKCPMAPDARIQSIEDLEAENDQVVMAAITTSVYELNAPQRNVVLQRFGLQTCKVWSFAHEQLIYDLAIRELHTSLSKRICV